MSKTDFPTSNSYYRSHIPNYAAIASPWTDVIGKTDKEAEKTPLVITEEMKQSFETLKARLTSAPILGFPYFRGEKAGDFILDTDFSKEQTAGVLSQMQNGKEVVLMYGSKKNSRHGRNMGSTKGELYAGMFWMQRYSYYIKYRPFIWRTDNSALVQTRELKSSIIERWLTTIGEFDFRVEHRAGTKHGNADSLSRGGNPEVASEDDEHGCAAVTPNETPLLSRQQQLFRHNKHDLRDMQESDEDLRHVFGWLRKDYTPDAMTVKSLSRVGKVYAGLLSEMSIDDDGLIRYKLPYSGAKEPRNVLCVPKALWETNHPPRARHRRPHGRRVHRRPLAAVRVLPWHDK